MKRKLVAALMVMTLALSCSVVALAEEPSGDGTEISQIDGEGEDKETEEKEGIVSDDSAKASKSDTVIAEDTLKEVKENDTEKLNPAADGEETAGQELPIDEAHFPDANFRKYIKDEFDTDRNGSFSQSEIEAVTALGYTSVHLDNVKDFKGIEYFSNTRYIVLTDMSTDSLDVSKNTKLEEMRLDRCQITNLVLNSDLLGFGYFKGSQITNVDVSNLKLKWLWCDGNLVPSLMSIPTLQYIKLYNDVHLPYLDLSNHNIRLVDEEYGDNGLPLSHDPMGGAFIAPQTLSRTVKSVNGVWTLDMASIVGRDYVDRVTLVTEGTQMSKDGVVTFQGSEVPKELVYNFDTKNPAETTLMEVTVNLSGVNDQTKEEVSVDTSGMDINSICKDNNVSPDKAEIVVSQETPSKGDADKLAGEADSKGLKVTATYEILLKLFSEGNEIAEITENFGSVTLTLQAGKDYAGRKAVIFQLHNGQVIEHDGLTVNADGTVSITVDKFSTFAVAVSEEPDNPTPPSQPDNPSQPENPSIPSPGVTLPQETIDNTIKIIKSTESGGSVSIDMDGATVISKEILEAAKGKDVDIQLNMGGYTWTINGKDIKDSNLKDINLQVIVDTKNIPSKTLQALAGDNPIRQLFLAHEGDFGFKASLTVNVGSEHSGQFGNLYYHDSDGKMVFINAGKINPDGNVSLEFSHASDYVIVMSDKEMSQSDVPAEISPTQKKEQSVSPKQSPKTGDGANIAYWMVLGMIALGVCGLFGRKKFYRG